MSGRCASAKGWVAGAERPTGPAWRARAWALFGPAPSLELVSAGPADPRYATMERLAAEVGARAVMGLGWVEESELEWLYANATLVLFPSRYEGFGFPLVEAFVRGL